MSLMSFSDFKAMIEISPINTKVFEFKNKNNKVVGIMLFDYQVDGLSAVYSFFDPNSSKNGLGNFMILKLIKKNDFVIITAGLPFGKAGMTNMVRLYKVGSK